MGLFWDERPVRKVSCEAKFDEPPSVGSAKLMPPRSIPAIAIAGFWAEVEKTDQHATCSRWVPSLVEANICPRLKVDGAMEQPLRRRPCRGVNGGPGKDDRWRA